MVKRKINDEEAYAFWVALGDRRSYGRVCEEFKVSRRCIQKCAARNKWSERIVGIERAEKQLIDQKLAETRAEVRERHLRMIRAMSARGLQALQKMELDTAFEGIRAIEMAVKLERLLLGETSEHVAHSVQELTRREVDTYLVLDGDTEEDDDDDEP